VREAFAAQQLGNQGYEVFFPRRLVTVRHARALRYRDASYFPNYIFVSLDLELDPWRAINGTFGVRSLVMFGGRPAAAPRPFVEQLQAMADPGGRLSLAGGFRPGDDVQILTGPFAELVGRIDRLEGRGRVRILMDLITGVLPIVADARNVALAS